MHYIRSLQLLAAVLTSASAASTGPCPLAGPGFAAPQALSNSAPVKAGAAAFKAAVAAALNGSSGAIALDAVTTTFSFEAWSAHEDIPILTQHYNGQAFSKPSQGVAEVNSDTIYRVGSLSKLITTYAYLAKDGFKHWNDPITNFIPELASYDGRYPEADGLEIIHWADITVGLLASQLAGIQKDLAVPKAVYNQWNIPGLPETLDIPANASGVTCNTYSKIPCTRASYLNSILATHPVYPPASEPVYSDMAYSLLALALENITDSGDDSFPSMLNTILAEPLNLTATTYLLPNISTHPNVIIPANDTYADFSPSLGLLQPGGGFYSSLNDLTKIGRSILSHTLLTPTQTRRWMKPAQFLADGISAIGAPWEIYQVPSTLALNASGTNKTTIMYTKSGDFGKYASYLVLFPDYDAGFSILAAGASASSTTRILADIAMTAFSGAFELAAKFQAEATLAGEYTGVFENAAGNASDTFELALATDQYSGLSVANYSINGVDMLEVYAQLGNLPKGEKALMRMYPSGLTTQGQNGTTIYGYRAIRYNSKTVAQQPVGAVYSSLRCQEWFNIGGVTSFTEYGAGGGLDEFGVVMGKGGEVQGVLVKTWDKVLGKAGTEKASAKTSEKAVGAVSIEEIKEEAKVDPNAVANGGLPHLLWGGRR